jgi:O-antigen ligase
MKEIFGNDTTENKVSVLLLALFAASLPFDRFYSELLLIVLLVHTAIHLRADRWRQVALPVLARHSTVFLLTLVATAWTAWPDVAFPHWERQMAILLLPLCLMLLPVDLGRYRFVILNGFILVNTVVAGYLYSDALRTMYFYHQPLHDLLGAAYIGQNFSEPLDLHATYLSLFFALSLTAALQQLLSGSGFNIKRIALVLATLLLAAGLFQLASRAVLASQLLLSLVVLPFTLSTFKKRVLFAAVLLAGCTGIFFLLRQYPQLYQRLITDMVTDLGTSRAAGVVSDPRGHRWELALELVKARPIFGHGTGSEVPLLREAYFRNGLYDSYLNGLNAHNEYLSIAIRSGLAGLLIWAGTLAAFLRQAWRERDLLLAAFFLLLLGTALSENLMDVNKGIFFYAFFLALLGLRRKKPAQGGSASNPAAVSAVFIQQPRKQPTP